MLLLLPLPLALLPSLLLLLLPSPLSLLLPSSPPSPLLPPLAGRSKRSKKMLKGDVPLMMVGIVLERVTKARLGPHEGVLGRQENLSRHFEKKSASRQVRE